MNDDAPDMLLHGSFDRCPVFLDYIEGECQRREGESVSDWLERQQTLGDYFWRTVSEWWTSMDHIEHENMAMYFQNFSEEWSSCLMSPENLRTFQRLPSDQPITIYRGQDADHPVGLAWTTDRAKAEWFARAGLRGLRGKRPAILTTQIMRHEIALSVSDRGEKEIVPFAIPTDFTLELLDDQPVALAA